MKIDRRSLGFRLLVPVFFIIGGITLSLFFFVRSIARHVQEDYARFAVSAEAERVATLLNVAASELTAARLTDNPVVVEAKQRSMVDAISQSWRHAGYDGIITGATGLLVMSTLDRELGSVVLERRKDGYFTVNGRVYCFSDDFPPWGWNVITVAKHPDFGFSRKELLLLAPLVLIGLSLMIGGVFLVLRRYLQRPVAEMLASVTGATPVKETGVTEFDRIGAAVNAFFAKIVEQREALQQELAERRKAEETVRLKEEHIRLLLDSTAEGIYGIDMDGVCRFCNPACLRLLGYEREEDIIGKNLHSITHHSYADGSPYPEEKCNIFTAYKEGRGVHVQDEVFWRPDGSKFEVEYWSYPVIEHGRITGAVVTFIDISERRKLESQLLQAQKMEAIGHLAGGVAHDFNNILTAIMGYGELVRRELGPGHPAQKYIDQVIISGEKASELTRGLLAFSRKQIINPRPTDINGVVSDIEKILRRVIGEDIDLRTKLYGSDLIVMIDKGQIDQVLLNLVTNARDSMTSGGLLTIETGYVVVDENYAGSHAMMKPGAYALVTVSDTGCGMDEKTRAKIFEPFFTTKELGKGTGLGLSIVYGIVQQHGGFINVYSERGRGTTFKIFFPLLGEVPAGASGAPEARGGSETILVAEDESTVRTMIRSMLEKYGYTVLEAENGEEAVRVFEANSNRIDLVLFDVIMPGKNGREAYEEIQRIEPGIKTLFMSGYTDDIIHRHGILDRGLEFLGKPLSAEKLLGKLREILDA